MGNKAPRPAMAPDVDLYSQLRKQHPIHEPCPDFQKLRAAIDHFERDFVNEQHKYVAELGKDRTDLVRVIPMGCCYTLDLVPGRVNYHLDDNGCISSIEVEKDP
eukprot:GILJ01025306.1.p1 GENE.GILJ01025306.1~~GILJ01025306.1.p1  ORF type:complete len:104 (-),score=3.52 GILJ01025306.1:202-513(-)